MKKIIFSLSIAILVGISAANAQKFGLEAGALMSKLDADLSVLGLINVGADAETEFGVYLGPTVEYDFSQQLSVQSGLFYNLRSSEVTFGNVANIDLDHSSIELPIRLRASFPLQGSDLILMTGPSFHLKVGETYKTNVLGANLDFVNDIVNINATEDFDMDWKFGAGVRFSEDWTIIGQYSLGLTDLINSGLLDLKFNYFSLGVNYTLPIAK